MRLRFDRYQSRHARLQWTSILLLVAGSLGVAFGSLSLWLGILMILMPDGGLWESRGGVVLAVFTGLFPLVISGVMVWRGLARRGEMRKLRDLAALARQSPTFTVYDVARALDVGPAHAHRVVVDALTSGVLEEGPEGIAQTMAALPVALPPAPGPMPMPAQPNQDIWIGAVLHATYRIDGHLAAGGMGTVYRAVHVRTGRRYAIKTLLPDARLSPDALRRFEREATAASALGHPNIIGVHDFNVTPEGAYYLVMDLLVGETLEHRLARRGSLPWPEAQKIALELGSALAMAHDHGLLHRDLKPANVFLASSGGARDDVGPCEPARAPGASERAVLLDFGLVKPIADAAVSRITVTGAAVGTPMYMSPEQARGEAVDARSDVYGLAAVLYEMVTGAPPFLDRTLASVYARLLTAPPETASKVADKPVPPAVDNLLARALAKHPGERFADVRELMTAIGNASTTLELRRRA